jgi:S-adenosylmethionine:tRNA ribosyltransferase-isomerase
MLPIIGKASPGARRKIEKVLTSRWVVVYFVSMYKKSDYTYTLPEKLIAEYAIQPHHDARLMVIDKNSGIITTETTFWNIDTQLGDGRVIFFNNSRVLRARVRLSRVSILRKDGTTGLIEDGEIFYLKTIDTRTIEALVRPGNKFREWTTIYIGDAVVRVKGTTDVGRILEVNESASIYEFLERYGSLPLPPYIQYSEEKEKDYQTSFASQDGSVAAPTASLHFTRELMDKIVNPKEYVTLHVWLGTFKWLDTDDIREYAIHREAATVNREIFAKICEYKAEWKKIVAVGTTACRTLESLPSLWKSLPWEIQESYDANIREYWNTLSRNSRSQNWIYRVHPRQNEIYFETEIYIVPGYIFSIVDDLVTNFHLGESSLLVLVSAFLWYEKTMEIYRYAISQQYRFYSFWDGMYIRWK